MPATRAAVIHWFRRDLRTADNPSLAAAAGHGLPVIPVYLLSGRRDARGWSGPNRQHFLCGCLAALAGELGALGGRLIIRHGDPVGALRQLISEGAVRAVHYNEAPGPFAKQLENQVRAMCAQLGVECHAHADAALHGPDEVLTLSGQPYRVFTPYSRNWLALPKPPPVAAPAALRTPVRLVSLPLPDVAHWGWAVPATRMIEPGAAAARARLRQAVAGTVQGYAARRDLPAADGTSRISQDLRFGLVSIRTVYAAAMRARAAADAAGRVGIDTWLKELAWREFYFAILHHYPNVLDEEFNADWRGLPWDERGAGFEAWQHGRTGFPIVDAGMRELLATGFMHNRVRMITAMFLTKDLHHDWKLGESHFMQHLVDGEIASNNGGWQWSAGTGADAAPYFRIQNPWSQTARFDPAGDYIRRWIPELAAVHPAQLLQPPANHQPLAPDYPLPCLDHKTERARTLAIFQRHRQQMSARR
ncbi:MAG: deoxyribodipyrimidine photo-lyase [Verrucomicrobiota bacterium]